MLSERLSLILEEAERRVAGKPIMLRGDPDKMSPETIAWLSKREHDRMIAEEMNRILCAYS